MAAHATSNSALLVVQSHAEVMCSALIRWQVKPPLMKRVFRAPEYRASWPVRGRACLELMPRTRRYPLVAPAHSVSEVVGACPVVDPLVVVEDEGHRPWEYTAR